MTKTQEIVTINALLLKLENLAFKLETKAGEIDETRLFERMQDIFSMKKSSEESVSFKDKKSLQPHYETSLWNCSELISESLQFILLKNCSEMTEFIHDVYDDQEILNAIQFDYNIKDTFSSYEFDFIIDTSEVRMNYNVFTSKELSEEGIIFKSIELLENDKIYCTINISKSDISNYALEYIDSNKNNSKKIENNSFQIFPCRLF
jgi:hypothetical protein